MKSSLNSDQDHKPFDLTPLRMLFAAVWISLVGILADGSAILPNPILFQPTSFRVKMDLTSCPATLPGKLCSNELSKESCFHAGNGLPTMNLSHATDDVYLAPEHEFIPRCRSPERIFR